MTIESLAEQELREANQYLVLFEEADRFCALFIGGSFVSAVALPVLLFFYWLIGSGPILHGLAAGIAFLGFTFTLGFWWLFRRNQHFKQIQSQKTKNRVRHDYPGAIWQAPIKCA